MRTRRISASLSGVERSRSVSSIRSTNVPPVWRATSQLNSAVRAPPTCRLPVGLGAKRTRAGPVTSGRSLAIVPRIPTCDSAPTCPHPGASARRSAGASPSAARASRSSRTTRAPGARSSTPTRRSPPSAPAPADAGIAPVVSHGLYLINLGAPDREVPTGPPGKPAVAMRNIYRASVESLVQHLATGHALGLDGVVLHVGSFKGSTEDESIARIGAGIAEAFDGRRGRLPASSSRTPPAPATRSAAPSPSSARWPTPSACRSAWPSASTPSTCSPRATRSTRTAASTACSPSSTSVLGMDRLRCLHLNDSKVGFASNRDRHENIGDGEIGEEGCGASSATPTCRACPSILEVPGMDGTRPRPGEHGPRPAPARGGRRGARAA